MNLAPGWESAQRHIAQARVLRVAEGRLLRLLQLVGPLPLKDISQRLGLEQSTVNRQVNSAIRAELITRERAMHERADRLHSTLKGRDLLARDTELHQQVYGTALQSIPAESREEFLAHLTQFVETLDTVAQQMKTK